jgi:hypothetical protein
MRKAIAVLSMAVSALLMAGCAGGLSGGSMLPGTAAVHPNDVTGGGVSFHSRVRPLDSTGGGVVFHARLRRLDSTGGGVMFHQRVRQDDSVGGGIGFKR